MTETNVFQLTQPGTFSDPLTEVLSLRAVVSVPITVPVASNRFCPERAITSKEVRKNGRSERI